MNLFNGLATKEEGSSDYPKAEVIRVVMDNLSTHSSGALYEAFPAPEAHRILHRLD